MDSLRVCVIGCGPSAMMIGHAAEQLGVPFRFIAPKQRSFISGAQYLHRDVGDRVDGISPSTVRYVRRGSSDVYQHKIYGRRLPPDLETSWAKFPDEVSAWPLVDIYEHLWNKYQDLIDDRSLTFDEAAQLGTQELTFNTAPLNVLTAGRGFVFHTEQVVIVHSIAYVPFGNCIVYNGLPTHAWYRSSDLWGHMSVEFPGSVRLPDTLRHRFSCRTIQKPLRSNAVVPNVIPSGRYGRWEKGVLVDESYFQAIDEIKARL